MLTPFHLAIHVDNLEAARGFYGGVNVLYVTRRDMRKHIAWYLKGFPAGGTMRQHLALVDSLAALDRLLDGLDADAPWPGADAEGQRGRAGTPKRVALPDGWLDSPDLSPEQQALVAQAELDVSGG